MTNVLIIDDHPLIREGIRRALSGTDFQVVGEASSLEEGMARFDSQYLGAVIVDLNLGSSSGLDFIKWARLRKSSCPIVVLTMDDRSSVLAKAKQAGASAYVLKEAPLSELVTALKFLQASPGKFFSRANVKSISKKVRDLTQRESEILALLPEGLSNREIGSLLFISEATVKTHLLTLYRKLEVSNRIQAIEVGRDNDLLSHEKS
ncbi:MAG: response regulator transcription factor [Actinomycetes bacterium]